MNKWIILIIVIFFLAPLSANTPLYDYYKISEGHLITKSFKDGGYIGHYSDIVRWREETDVNYGGLIEYDGQNNPVLFISDEKKRGTF
ncbi:MAG: hypothetical protein KAS49_00120, partial [Candidatus Cloacimonetes bacterium]|nr:hypothetical protein [Candidatus Cloacimonadota bacterium]